MELAEYKVRVVETDKQGEIEDNLKILCGHLGEDYLDLEFVNQLGKYCPEEESLFRSEN